MAGERNDSDLSERSTEGLLGRMAATGNLLVNLDRHLIAALEGLEEMRGHVAGLGGAEDDVKDLVADLRGRVGALHERLDRDLDGLRDALLAKIEDVDVSGLGRRLDRVEEAILNIERATTGMERAFENTLQALPDFMTRKIRPEGEAEVDGAHPR